MLQSSYPAKLNADQVASRKREIVARNNPGTGQQNCAVRKGLAAEQIAYQFVELAFDVRDGSLAFEDGFVAPANFKLDAPFSRFCFISAYSDERAECAGP